MESSSPQNPLRAFFGSRWFLTSLLALGILAAIAIPFAAVRSSVSNTLADTTTSDSLAPGSQATIVVKITGIQSDNSLKALLLNRVDDKNYSLTAQSVVIRWNTQQVVLGTSQDIHTDAVVRVEGKVDSNGDIRADQLTVLTTAVQVH